MTCDGDNFGDGGNDDDDIYYYGRSDGDRYENCDCAGTGGGVHHDNGHDS